MSSTGVAPAISNEDGSISPLVGAPALGNGCATRKCEFCAEEILEEARKCKHCGEFADRSISVGVGIIFALGLITACVLAGFQPAASDGVVAVGVWAIFVLLFARTIGPVLAGLRASDLLGVGVNGYRRVCRFFLERGFFPKRSVAE
jgi:hypothetical protein